MKDGVPTIPQTGDGQQLEQAVRAEVLASVADEQNTMLKIQLTDWRNDPDFQGLTFQVQQRPPVPNQPVSTVNVEVPATRLLQRRVVDLVWDKDDLVFRGGDMIEELRTAYRSLTAINDGIANTPGHWIRLDPTSERIEDVKSPRKLDLVVTARDGTTLRLPLFLAETR